MLVGEVDEYTRVVIQKLLQPTKQTQVVVAGLLRRTTQCFQESLEERLQAQPNMRVVCHCY